MARLVFLGTPDAAVAPLRTLVDAGHTVALVVTRPDKRRGRGADLLPSPVKAAALELGLPVTDALGDASAVDAELGVVVAYGRIIPVAVLDRLPMVNLHFSLLPRWRGAAPVERAILEGDGETGVCLMAVEAGLDTGGIYAVAATEVDEDESAEHLRRRLVDLGCDLLTEHLAEGVGGLPVPHDQEGDPSYAEKISASERQLHWSQPAVHLRRVARVGRAWTTFGGRRLGVLVASGVPAGEVPSDGTDGDVAGTLRGTAVLAGDGEWVRLVTVQPEGKRPMAADDWIRGLRPGPGLQLGS